MLITEVTNTQLNEYFPIIYDMFGWIAPGGKVMRATKKQSADPKKSYIHSQLAKEWRLGSTKSAYRAGYVRWLCRDGILVMETEQPISDNLITTVNTAVQAIEKLAQDPKNFRHFPGTKDAFHILFYQMGAKNFYREADSLRELVQAMRGHLERTKSQLKPVKQRTAKTITR